MGIGSSIFLILPRILGKLIDEHDDTKKNKEEDEEDDIALQMAKYFKENPMSIFLLLLAGATAICFRTYCKILYIKKELVMFILRYAYRRPINN